MKALKPVTMKEEEGDEYNCIKRHLFANLKKICVDAGCPTYGDAVDRLEVHSDRLERMTSVVPSFKIASEIIKSPMFLQPRHVIVIDSPNTIGMQTFGFVGELQDVRGGPMPSGKYTRLACRISISNLLSKDFDDEKMLLRACCREIRNGLLTSSEEIIRDAFNHSVDQSSSARGQRVGTWAD